MRRSPRAALDGEMTNTPRPRKPWFLLVLLVASVLLNMLLLAALHVSFVKLQLARVFPYGEPERPREITVRSKRLTLVMAGDSRALLWDAGGLRQCFDVANLGTGGHTSSQVLMKLRQRLPPRGAWVLLEFGINDIHPLGGFPRYGEAVLAGLMNNIETVTRLLRDNDNQVILSSVFPPGRVPLARRPYWDARSLPYLQQVNGHIKTVAAENGAVFLDAAAILIGKDGYLNPAFQAPDFFLHVNAQAYAALNAALLAQLRDARGVSAECIAAAESHVTPPTSDRAVR